MTRGIFIIRRVGPTTRAGSNLRSIEFGSVTHSLMDHNQARFIYNCCSYRPQHPWTDTYRNNMFPGAERTCCLMDFNAAFIDWQGNSNTIIIIILLLLTWEGK